MVRLAVSRAFRLATLIVAGSVTLSEVAAAQVFRRGTYARDSSACLARIPDSLMTRTGVYMSVDLIIPADSTAKLATPEALALSRAMAMYARELLGATAGQVPAAEPVVTWRDADGTMRVAVHRGGNLSFADLDTKRAAIGGAAILLEGGLTSAINSGFRFEWPAGVTSDSIVFDIDLENEGAENGASVKRSGSQEPIFTVMTPRSEPVRIRTPGRTKYPPGMKGLGMEGYLNLTYVVDTAGRAEMETLRDIWPTGRPRHTGEMARYYDAFLEAVRQAVRGTRFSPARQGGCPVRMWVQQAFDFRLDK